MLHPAALGAPDEAETKCHSFLQAAMSDPETPGDDPEPHNALRRNRWEAIAWVIFGLVFYLMTFEFDRPLPYYKLGPAFWPQAILIGIMVFGMVLLVSTFLSKAIRKPQRSEHSLGEALKDEKVPLTPKLVAFFLAPLIWVLAMRWVGFPLTAPIFLIAFLWLVGVRRWWAILLYTTLFDGALMLLFYKLIFTPMPQGAGRFYTLNGYIIGFMQ